MRILTAIFILISINLFSQGKIEVLEYDSLPANVRSEFLKIHSESEIIKSFKSFLFMDETKFNYQIEHQIHSMSDTLLTTISENAIFKFTKQRMNMNQVPFRVLEKFSSLKLDSLDYSRVWIDFVMDSDYSIFFEFKWSIHSYKTNKKLNPRARQFLMKLDINGIEIK